MKSNDRKWHILLRYLSWAKDEWIVFGIYGLAFSLLNLIVPFSVQILVNNLALSGLRLTLLSLAFLFLLVLCALQFCRYSQIVLMEYLERKIIFMGKNWFDQKEPDNKIMYYELMGIPKNLSKWSLDGFEIILTLTVGTFVLIIYHPYFLMLSIFIYIGLYGVTRLGVDGLDSSLKESKEKYKNWFYLSVGKQIDINSWLSAREAHFSILKSQMKLLMIIQIFGHVAVLLGGAFLFDANQLSLGQFVSAEIIGNGVFFSMSKLATFLETHYGLLTSFVKIDHARGGQDVS